MTTTAAKTATNGAVFDNKVTNWVNGDDAQVNVSGELRPCWSFTNNKERIVCDQNVGSPIPNTDLYLLTIEFRSDLNSRSRNNQHSRWCPPISKTSLTSQALQPPLDSFSGTNATTNGALSFPSEQASCTSDFFIFNLIESFTTSTTPLTVQYIKILAALGVQEDCDGGNIIAEPTVDSGGIEQITLSSQTLVSKATLSTPQKYKAQIAIDCSNIRSKSVSISSHQQPTAKSVGTLSAINVEMDCAPLIEEAADGAGVVATLTQSPQEVSKIVLRILGMKCHKCVNKIINSTNDLSGIQSVKINLSEKCGTFLVQSNFITSKELVDHLKVMGFESSVIPDDSGYTCNVMLAVSGMKSGKCEKKIHSKLLAVPGVKGAEVSQPNSSAKVTFDASVLESKDIAVFIRQMEFVVQILSPVSSVSFNQ